MNFNTQKTSFRFFLFGFFLLLSHFSFSQKNEKIAFLQPADSLHKARFVTSSILGAAAYGATVVGLSQIWYADAEQTQFHLFNDWGEWQHVDKMGHAFTAYNYMRWGFAGARWTGMKRKSALWTVAGASFLLQGTIEVMDGFSAKWGFSIPDVGFNTLGIGLFVGQELVWKEQRILIKVSSTIPDYPTESLTSVDGLHSTTFQKRAKELYGTRFPETFLKDYNAQTNWLSFNIHSFIKNKNTRFPKWLNMAIGYGAQNMYEGFGYEWTEEKTGIQYARNPEQYPRYRQIYFSFDVDLSRIKTNSRFLKTTFNVLNFIKIPAPTLEFNSLGKVRFIPIYF